MALSWEVYKAYKHNEDYEWYGINTVYNTLKKNSYQVVIVDNCMTKKKKLYNYVPAIDEFELIMEESY